MITVNGLDKHAELDDYESGCLLDDSFNFNVDVKFTGSTVGEVIEEIKSFLGIDNDDCVSKNPCEDDGSRVDFQVMENEHGHPASTHDIERWKLGKMKLWLCDYTAYFTDVIIKSINVEKTS
jgi:hypothetical protein